MTRTPQSFPGRSSSATRSTTTATVRSTTISTLQSVCWSTSTKTATASRTSTPALPVRLRALKSRVRVWPNSLDCDDEDRFINPRRLRSATTSTMTAIHRWTTTRSMVSQCTPMLTAMASVIALCRARSALRMVPRTAGNTSTDCDDEDEVYPGASKSATEKTTTATAV